jgi:hypothetical protein
MSLDQLLDQGQPDPGPGFPVSIGGLALEATEQAPA